MQMSTVVNPTNVLIGPEFVPRKPAGPGVLLITSGQVYTPGPSETWDYVEIQSGGTLLASRTVPTVFSVITLIVLPGGTLDLGSDASPQTGSFELIFRDVPIDTMVDPFQWGNGLLNFGTRTQVAPAKTPWGLATGDVLAGATTLTLSAVPNNWDVGDDIYIPDMDIPAFSRQGTSPPRRETPVTILDIAGAAITLSKPLDFEHLIICTPPIDFSTLTAEEVAGLAAQGITDGTPSKVLYPRVLNLTRQHIMMRSENPRGTRGHQVDIGNGAMWDCCYNRTEGLGRTTIQPLDVTVFPSPFTGTPTHIGTNQIARYNAHHHHCDSSPMGCDCGNVWIGDGSADDAAKWAISVHSTSDALIEDNIALDFPGACFVTEDGNEVRNRFNRNFGTSYTYAVKPDGTRPDARDQILSKQPGCGGTPFWFHGILNTFTANEGWNGFGSGFTLINFLQPAGILYPSAPGMMPDTPLPPYAPMVPLAFSDNVTACNTITGIDLWAVATFPMVNLIAAYNLGPQVDLFATNNIAIDLRNALLIGKGGIGECGVRSSKGYVTGFAMTGGQIRGCAVGISGGGSGNIALGMSVTGTVLQNVLDIDLLPQVAVFESVLHLPLDANPPQSILFYPNVWTPGQPLPKADSNIPWIHDRRRSHITVQNWQGTGKDYQLFYPQQRGDTAAWASHDGGYEIACPIEGLTQQQCFDTYGIAWDGDYIAPADDVTLVGLVNGHARLGLAETVLGPPRAIMTFPTLRAPAPVHSDGTIDLWCMVTGDSTSASPNLMCSIDGATPFPAGPRNPGEDSRVFQTTVSTPDVHTVQLWRTTLADPTVEIPGSRFTSRYVVGAIPPPPPPPPTTTTVPNLVGLSQTDALAALTAAGLTLGTVTVVETVVSQSPAAAASVIPGSAVNLIVH